MAIISEESRKLITEKELCALRKEMLECKTLDEAQNILKKINEEKNINLIGDDYFETLKNIFILTAEAEKSYYATFINYARKILESTIEDKEKIVSIVIEDISKDFADKKIVGHNIGSIDDIKNLIDSGHVNYILKPSYVKNEKAIVEARDLFDLHNSWYKEIADEMETAPDSNFDDRDFLPITHLLLMNNANFPDFTKDEFQKMSRSVKNIIESGDKDKIYKIFDQIYDTRDNTELVKLDYDKTSDCYKALTILSMSQTFGTVTDNNRDYKDQRFNSDSKGVEAWDKALERSNTEESLIADELLNYGIAINDICGEMTLPFKHYSEKYQPKKDYEKNLNRAFIGFYKQKHEIVNGEAQEINLELTDGLIRIAELGQKKQDMPELIRKFDALMNNCGSNMFHSLLDLKLNSIREHIYVGGVPLKEACEKYIEKNPEFIKNLKAQGNDGVAGQAMIYLAISLLEGKPVDMVHINKVNGKYEATMMPINIVNLNNLQEDYIKGVNYEKAKQKNAVNRENRLKNEKNHFLMNLKKCKLESDFKNKLSDISNADNSIDRIKYGNYDRNNDSIVDEGHFQAIEHMDINGKEFTDYVDKVANEYVSKYKNNSAAREAEEKTRTIGLVNGLVEEVENANVALYSAGRHPEFAAVREAVIELKKVYSIEKPNAAYMDLESEAELKVYYKRIFDANKKLEIASKIYCDNRKGVNEYNSSERAYNRYAAVKKCLEFTQRAANTYNTYVNKFGVLLTENKKNKLTLKKINNYKENLTKSVTKLENAKTLTNSEEYEALINSVKKANEFQSVLVRYGNLNNKFVADEYKKNLNAVINGSVEYIKHKVKDGIKANAYDKLDAVIDLYLNAVEMRNVLVDKIPVSSENNLIFINATLARYTDKIKKEGKVDKEGNYIGGDSKVAKRYNSYKELLGRVKSALIDISDKCNTRGITNIQVYNDMLSKAGVNYTVTKDTNKEDLYCFGNISRYLSTKVETYIEKYRGGWIQEKTVIEELENAFPDSKELVNTYLNNHKYLLTPNDPTIIPSRLNKLERLYSHDYCDNLVNDELFVKKEEYKDDVYNSVYRLKRAPLKKEEDVKVKDTELISEIKGKAIDKNKGGVVNNKKEISNDLLK